VGKVTLLARDGKKGILTTQKGRTKRKNTSTNANWRGDAVIPELRDYRTKHCQAVVSSRGEGRNGKKACLGKDSLSKTGEAKAVQ